MKKAIVVGASSGIGRELSKVLAKDGYEVGLVARRLDLLQTLQKEIPTKTVIRKADIGQALEARDAIESLISEMGGMDLMVINSGVGFLNPGMDWEKEKETLDVNVKGFCILACQAYRYFHGQGHGHLVGISSIIALRGSEGTPAYSASKAFMSNYLEGLRKKAFKENKKIYFTDIKPGWVDTPMAMGENKFWVATPQEAAQQINTAIQKKKKIAYITRRWRLIAWLLKILPCWLYDRV